MVTDIVPVIFRTEVMTEKTKDLYRQIINQFLVELKIQPNQLKGRVEIIALKFAKDLDMSKFVNLKKLEGATLNKNFTMPFGITEPQLVRCFITDNNNFGLDLQQDFGVISHEMAHWILIHLRPSQRAKLRNDDRRSGYKKGVVYYLDGGHLRGVLLWNVWDKVDAARDLIRSVGPKVASQMAGKI